MQRGEVSVRVQYLAKGEVADVQHMHVSMIPRPAGRINFVKGPADPASAKPDQHVDIYTRGSMYELRHPDGRIAFVKIDDALQAACKQLFTTDEPLP